MQTTTRNVLRLRSGTSKYDKPPQSRKNQSKKTGCVDQEPFIRYPPNRNTYPRRGSFVVEPGENIYQAVPRNHAATSQAPERPEQLQVDSDTDLEISPRKTRRDRIRVTAIKEQSRQNVQSYASHSDKKKGNCHEKQKADPGPSQPAQITKPTSRNTHHQQRENYEAMPSYMVANYYTPSQVAYDTYANNYDDNDSHVQSRYHDQYQSSTSTIYPPPYANNVELYGNIYDQSLRYHQQPSYRDDRRNAISITNRHGEKRPRNSDEKRKHRESKKHRHGHQQDAVSDEDRILAMRNSAEYRSFLHFIVERVRAGESRLGFVDSLTPAQLRLWVAVTEEVITSDIAPLLEQQGMVQPAMRPPPRQAYQTAPRHSSAPIQAPSARAVPVINPVSDEIDIPEGMDVEERLPDPSGRASRVVTPASEMIPSPDAPAPAYALLQEVPLGRHAEHDRLRGQQSQPIGIGIGIRRPSYDLRPPLVDRDRHSPSPYFAPRRVRNASIQSDARPSTSTQSPTSSSADAALLASARAVINTGRTNYPRSQSQHQYRGRRMDNAIYC